MRIQYQYTELIRFEWPSGAGPNHREQSRSASTTRTDQTQMKLPGRITAGEARLKKGSSDLTLALEPASAWRHGAVSL